MTAEVNSTEQEIQKPKVMRRGVGSEAVYGFGLIGAWIYYIGHATTLWLGVLGFFKGLFWPALLIYELLTFLKM